MSFHWIDLLILGLVFLSTLTGLFRGFVKELIAIVVWVVAIWLAYRYSQMLDPWLQKYLHDKTVRVIASFILILLAVLLAGGLVSALLNFILRSTGLGGIDRLLGLVFGAVRGIFIIALIITIIQMTSFPYQTYTKDSLLYPKFKPLVSWFQDWMPRLIKPIKVPGNVSADEE